MVFMKFLLDKETEKSALINRSEYQRLYLESIKDSDNFWDKQAEILTWFKRFSQVKNTSFDLNKFSIEWYLNGKLNASYNCLDRHLKKNAEKIAIFFEGENEKDSQTISYSELHKQVCKLSNVLKSLDIKKGDRVCIYMPLSIEAVIAMLSCARIGAIHSVVFAGFSAESLAGRIDDSGAKILITADQGRRGGKIIPLKTNCDQALELSHLKSVEKIIVVRNTGAEISMTSRRDYFYDELMNSSNENCEAEMMDSEDPLFILYTSGSTGKPKGLVHTTAGYLVYASFTHQVVFDYKENEVYWCTADVGWITGHSYVVYGPLCNGASIVIYEGTPSYPSFERYWQIIDKYKVNIFYTSPTALRSLMKEGDSHLESTTRQSLRVLGSVGEPINQEAWLWFYEKIGKSNCRIVDTWWQTETGGIMITPLVGVSDLKPSAADIPFFGILPKILDANSQELPSGEEGALCIKNSWPAQARTIWNDHERFLSTYYSAYKGYYFTGDGARTDFDGSIYITGRVDDVINVSGHRLSTAEIENAVNHHESIAESACVGYPHDIKGEGIFLFVILKNVNVRKDDLMSEIINITKTKIGGLAAPDKIVFVNALPKTRSGKIMRRILRKIAKNDLDNLGDISTLAEPEVIDSIIKAML